MYADVLSTGDHLVHLSNVHSFSQGSEYLGSTLHESRISSVELQWAGVAVRVLLSKVASHVLSHSQSLQSVTLHLPSTTISLSVPALSTTVGQASTLHSSVEVTFGHTRVPPVWPGQKCSHHFSPIAPFVQLIALQVSSCGTMS